MAIGNFDGMHKGHCALLKSALEGEAPKLMLSFEPHPRVYFAPETPPFQLTQTQQKAEIFAQMGGEMAVLPFAREFAALSAEEFVASIICDLLGASRVVVGESFRFGRNRRGDVETLRRMGRKMGFALSTVPLLYDATREPYSSSRIRELLSQGEVQSAGFLLGRPFEIIAKVRRGAGKGRQLGFPTANLLTGAYMRPAYGVYAVRVAFGGRERNGVANFGTRPTIDKNAPALPQLEVFIFDWEGEIYGRTLRVRFIERIREERNFASLAELTRQIGLDANRARALLAQSFSHPVLPDASQKARGQP